MIASSAHPLFRDAMRMLKHKFDIKFNFIKDEIKKETDADVLQWITTMVDGTGVNKVSYLSEPFPARPLKSNMHITFNSSQLSAVYLINDEKVEQLKNKGCFLIAPEGEEINILSHLIIKDSDYSFDKKIRISDMQRWSAFNDHLSPCSDIILVDQYILCDEGIYEYNLFSLIKTLLLYVNDAKTSIVIITRKSHYIKEIGADLTPDWNKVKEGIKSAAESVCKTKPNVTFVLSPTDIGEHDRTIFTNYRRVYSGDSFNYFDSKGTVISRGKEVHLCSMADADNYQLGFRLLNDIQRLINTAKKRNDDLIIGDRKSNYLNFD